MAETGPTSYDGFLSYSHAADDLLAPRLQAGLQRFAKPWWKRRALRVFRDEASLSANPHLWSSITDALDDSDWFVLLLSPDAAQSEWVNREIDYWTEHRDPQKILPVVTDGEFGWSDGDVAGDAAPASLQGVFSDEPRWVDLRFARTETQLNLRHARFRDAVADIAAAVRGVAKDELESEEIRQHRRTVRTAWTGSIAILALGIAAAVGAVVAYNAQQDAEVERDRASILAEQEAAARTEAEAQTVLAEQEAARAEEEAARADAEAERATQNADEATQAALENRARYLASAALLNLDTDPERSILLALEAVKVAGSSDVPVSEPWTALHKALAASRLVDRLPGGEFVDFSPDGSLLATGVDGGTTIWNATTGEELMLLPSPEGREALWASFSPDGQSLAVSYDNTGEAGPLVVVWEVVSGEEIVNLDAAEFGGGYTVAFDPSGTLLAADAYTQGSDIVIVWDIDTWAERYRVDIGPGQWTGAPSFSPDGMLLAVAQSNGVHLYNASDGSPAKSLETPSDWDLMSTAFAPDGQQVAALSQFPPVMGVWDVESGVSLYTKELEQGPATIEWDPTGRYIAVSGNDAIPRLLDSATGEETMRLLGQDTWVSSLSFDPAGEALAGAGGGYNWTTLIWDVSPVNVREVAKIETPYPGVEWIEYSADGESILLNSDEPGTASTLARLDVSTGEVVATIGDQISDFPFTPLLAPEAGLVATLGNDDSAALHDSITFEKVTDVPEGRYVLALSQDGDRAVLNDLADRPAVLVEVGSWNTILTLDFPRCRWASFSPDGKLMTCWSADTLEGYLFDAESGSLIAIFDPPDIAQRFSPDGTLLEARPWDGGLKLFDVPALVAGVPPDDAIIWSIQAHDGGIPQARFDADGAFISTVGNDNQLRVWDTSTGQLVADFGTLYGTWPASVMSPNQSHLIAEDAEGTIQVLTLDPDELIDIARSRITRSFTDGECDTYRIDPCPDLATLRGG